MQQTITRSAKWLALAAAGGAWIVLGGCHSSSDSKPQGGGGMAGASDGEDASLPAEDAAAAGASGGAGASGAAGDAQVGGADSMPAPTDYAADDPNLAYTGRIDFTNPKRPRFAAPGVYVQTRFQGSALAVKLRDSNEAGRANYVELAVDDAMPLKIRTNIVATEYRYTLPLSPGEHTVTFVKRTEASVGYLELLGFGFDGPILPAPAKPDRRIEIIGDSISAGSGLEAVNGSAECMQSYGEPWSDAYKSYGAVAARALNAEYHITAVSGIGLIRNYSQQYDARPMPEVYDTLYFEQKTSPAWDTTRFQPHAIVIALGTNDFSPGDGQTVRTELLPASYAEQYEAFIEKLRTYYPGADYFCLSSPMLGDGYPDASKHYATDLNAALNAVEAHYAALGDTKVHKVLVSKLAGGGCGTHPNVAQHATVAGELQQAIQAALGW